MTHLILALALLAQDPLDALDAKQGIKKGAPPTAAAPAQPTPPDGKSVKASIPGFSDAESQPVTGEANAPPAEAKKDEKPAEADAGSSASGLGLLGLIDGIMHSGAMGLMIDGGFFMWPILFMGILAAGVIIERWRTLSLISGDSRELRARVLELLQADQAEEALQLCSRESGPSAAVLTAGLRKYVVLRKLNYDPAKIEEQVIKAMEDYGIHIVAALEKHLPILATVSSVAPMVGSVGTVWGMIILFQDIVAQMGQTNIIEAAAAGIQLKLLVTVWGLIVGIPAYVAFNYFTTVINRYVLKVEEAATELVEAVTLRIATQTPNRERTESVRPETVPVSV